MPDASLIVSIVALGVSTASASFTFANLREARKANAKALVDFMREYRDYEPDRRLLIRELRKHPSRLGTSELPDCIREEVNHVCHYLDHLGFLVAKGVVKPEDVAGLMGHSILVTWGVLRPYIMVERQKRDRDYAPYLEHLSEAMYAAPINAIHRRLQHLSPTAKLPAPIIDDPASTHHNSTAD